MKYLGIDFGLKRVGVALSDDGGVFAFPTEIIPTETADERIGILCREHKVSGIVFGESIATNEQKNEVDSRAKRFAEHLAKQTKLPLFFEREDFSSVEAHRYQVGAGARDDSAAAIILQRFLDKQKK